MAALTQSFVSKLVLSACIAGGLSLGAARATAQTTSVELNDENALVRYALSHNLDLRSAHWDQDVASAGVSSASALSNPVARGEWLHVQSPNDYGFGLGLDWAPPQPGVYGAGKEAARARVRAVKSDFRERAAELEAGVRLGYARVAILEQEIALAEQSVGTRRSVHQAVKERMAHGAASRIDLSLAAVSLARGEQERDLLVLSRATAVSQLEALLGLPVDQTLDLKAGAPESDAADAKTSAAALEQRAVLQRPVLRADAARADAAEQTASAERAKRWPWLELQARYRRHDQSNYPDDVTLGLEVTLPIFNQNPGPIAAAEASRRQWQDVAAAHRSGIEHEVRALHAESERRREIAEHYAQSIAPVLGEHAALVKQALAGMELDLTALLSAEDLVTRGGIEYLEARLAQRQAQIALARALGQYGQAGGAGSQ